MAGPAVPTDLVELGRIAGAYGVRGWLRIHAYATHDTTLLHATQWWLKSPAPQGSDAGDFHCVTILQVREHGAHLVAQVQGLTDRDQALALKAHTVWVPRSEFAPAATDEYYWTDLVGCQLFGEDDSGQSVLLGEVIHVSDNGAHALLHVQRLLSQPDGSQTPQRNARGRPRIDLIPFVGAHVHTVDLAARQLLSNWPSSF